MEIDPVYRPIIDPKLAYTFPDWFHIAEVAERKSSDANLNSLPRLVVPKPANPIAEGLGLAHFDQPLTIVHTRDLKQVQPLSECRSPAKTAVSFFEQ